MGIETGGKKVEQWKAEKEGIEKEVGVMSVSIGRKRVTLEIVNPHSNTIPNSWLCSPVMEFWLGSEKQTIEKKRKNEWPKQIISWNSATKVNQENKEKKVF